MLALKVIAAEAIGGVVVDDADGLHPGVDDDGADEFKAALFESFGDGFGERGAGEQLAGALDGLAAGHGPHPF